MLKRILYRYSTTPIETKLLYVNRLLTATVISVLCVFALSDFCLAAGTTQQSLLAGSIAERRALANKIFGGFGWLVVGYATAIAAFDFFQRREMSILVNLAVGIIIWRFLGHYFCK